MVKIQFETRGYNSVMVFKAVFSLVTVITQALVYCVILHAEQVDAAMQGRENALSGHGGAAAARIYRSPEERREAGLGTAVTDWLTVSGLLELEKEYTKNKFDRHISTSENQRPSQILQLGFTTVLSDWFEAELIFEAENGKKYHAILDEAVASFEIGDWGIKLGRQSVPFGEYYSHFVTGPMLEFGETGKESLVIDFAITEQIEALGFAFKGDADKHTSRHSYDWGLGVEYATQDESIRLGARAITSP